MFNYTIENSILVLNNVIIESDQLTKAGFTYEPAEDYYTTASGVGGGGVLAGGGVKPVNLTVNVLSGSDMHKLLSDWHYGGVTFDGSITVVGTHESITLINGLVSGYGAVTRAVLSADQLEGVSYNIKCLDSEKA